MRRLAWLALAWTAHLCAQAPFPPAKLERLLAGLRDVYNLEYDRAEDRFQRMIDEAPADPAGYCYLAWTYWVRELGTNQELTIDRFAASDFFAETPRQYLHVDPALEARFRRMSGLAVDKARARLENQPDDREAQFLLGFAYQNLASFEAALKHNWWAAFRYGSRTYRYHRELLRESPDLHDARLAVGVYQYVTGSLSWSARWIAFLMGYRGSQERGKQELALAAQKAALTADDARVVLTLIYTRERSYQKAFDQLSELLRRYPQNYLAHLDMGGMALRMKRPEAAVEIYQDILRRQDSGMAKYAGLERAYVFNRLGSALRQKGDLEASRQWLGKALADPRASERSQTIARLELGKTLDLLGRRAEAREHYLAVTRAPDIAGSRQEAQDLLRHPYRQ